MIKRLLLVLLIPLTLITFPFELFFYALKWIITGKEFPFPLFAILLDPDLKDL